MLGSRQTVLYLDKLLSIVANVRRNACKSDSWSLFKKATTWRTRRGFVPLCDVAGVKDWGMKD